MAGSPSSWRSRTLRAALLALLAAGAALAPEAVTAQDDDLDAVCASAGAAASECRVAAAAARLIHPRVGLGLWGGSPVPGSASTLGMRLGSFPRISLSGRLTVLPMELPPLPDRSRTDGSRALAAGLSGQATVGLLTGWSPAPTVGGVGSLDAMARASWLNLPGDQGFDEGSVWGASLGLRLGLLRESFTLPGVSVTGYYGLSTGVTFGEPGSVGGGHIEGSLSGLGATAAATKRVGPVGVTAGVSWDRFSSDLELSWPGGPATVAADATTDRWSAFANASWTFLIFHGSLEAGWQEAPTPGGLPASVSLDPTGWWVGGAFRVSI